MIQKIQRMSVDPLASFYRKVSKKSKKFSDQLKCSHEFQQKIFHSAIFFQKESQTLEETVST